MTKISFEDLIKKVNEYIIDFKELELISNAFSYASKLHEGQKRQSGEDYIVHPVTAAFIFAETKVKTEKLCAALLHDTIEDTNITKEKIEILISML